MSKKSASKSNKKSIKDDTFSVYIYRLLKEIHPDHGISSNAMIILSRICLFVIRRYATECSSLLISANKKVVDVSTICAATFIIYGNTNVIGDIFPNAIIKLIEISLDKYENYTGGKEKMRQEHKAGLQISVSRVKKIYKAANANSKSISNSSAIAIATSLQYLLSEIIELSGNASRDNKKTRINPRHLMLAIGYDAELSSFLLDKGLILGGGGVIPNIHAQLLPSKKE